MRMNIKKGLSTIRCFKAENEPRHVWFNTLSFDLIHGEMTASKKNNTAQTPPALTANTSNISAE